MDAFYIRGGVPLYGAVEVAGAKNAALPILAASLLCDGPITLHNVPHLRDVTLQTALLSALGVAVRRLGSTVRLYPAEQLDYKAPRKCVARLRASFCVLGPLLARRGRAVVPLPGGCRIGPRPVGLHLAGLAALGAEIEVRRGCVFARARRLLGATIDLLGPHGPTVTGTANVLMAAVLARGETRIVHAAREPEIVDLGHFLNRLGARVEGLGESTLIVRGVEQLGGGQHTLIPDRIEAATLLLAGAITRGAVTALNVAPLHLTSVLETMTAAGAEVTCGIDWARVAMRDRPKAVDVTALPYPGLPSDVQALFSAWLSLARGESRLVDRVFPHRFGHADALRAMGARITNVPGGVELRGVPELRAARVIAGDLRASAALVLAGLAASGTTEVANLAHLDRGYDKLEDKLSNLGARIERHATSVTSTRSRRTRTAVDVLAQ